MNEQRPAASLQRFFGASLAETDPELAEAHASRGLALTYQRRFDEAVPALAGKGESAAAVALGTTQLAANMKAMKGTTIASQWPAPDQARTAASRPAAHARRVPNRSMPAIPSRITIRLVNQAPAIWPTMTKAKRKLYTENNPSRTTLFFLMFHSPQSNGMSGAGRLPTLATGPFRAPVGGPI